MTAGNPGDGGMNVSPFSYESSSYWLRWALGYYKCHSPQKPALPHLQYNQRMKLQEHQFTSS